MHVYRRLGGGMRLPDGSTATPETEILPQIADQVCLIGSPDASERMATVAEAGLAQLPAALVIIAVAALAFAVLPRLSIALGWAVVLLAIVLGQLGGLFGFPEWLRDISPFSHTPIVTAADIDWAAAWIMLGLAGLIAVSGLIVLLTFPARF